MDWTLSPCVLTDTKGSCKPAGGPPSWRRPGRDHLREIALAGRAHTAVAQGVPWASTTVVWLAGLPLGSSAPKPRSTRHGRLQARDGHSAAGEVQLGESNCERSS